MNINSNIFFGTYKLTEKNDLYKALSNAIKSNIHYFDLAELYKNQQLIGNYFKENNIDRQDIWITSKISLKKILWSWQTFKNTWIKWLWHLRKVRIFH